MNPTIQLLQATKERLFERGWIKNSAGSEEGPNCVLGALGYAHLEMNREQYEVRTAHHGSWTALYDAAGTFPSAFNDARETTFDDVLDLIDRAIKMEEAK